MRRTNGPKGLLKLFSPQLLYTWLDQGGIEDIPFRSFGYSSSSSLVQDLQDELVGQIAMRADLEQSEKLSSILGLPWTELLSANFAKVEAYVIAKDINVPRDHERQKAYESLVR